MNFKKFNFKKIAIQPNKLLSTYLFTNLPRLAKISLDCGCSSAVERFLAKEEAVGSSPITRSNRNIWKFLNRISVRISCFDEI